MKVKKLLLPLSIICISLFALAGCTKTTDYKAGAYTASNIEVYDSLTIEHIRVELFTQDNADDELLAISLVYHGNEIIATDCALTNYSKELKIAFSFEDKTGYIIAKAKQKGDEIFIEGNLTIDNNTVDIKLTSSDTNK